jgi:integrase
MQKQKIRRLNLQQSDMPDLKIGVRKNGLQLAVRSNRDRFFYPNEWMKFSDSLVEKRQKITFDVLLQTGARINEIRHIKVGDIDFERNNIILRVTKVKARKGEKNPRPRTISISSQFARRLKQYAVGRDNEDYLGILSTPAANICLKKALYQLGIKDYYMFSIHNIRKTHGNWLKALGVEGAEICLRLGHDMNTYLKAYGSPDIFNYKDLQDMRVILGDLYSNFRRGNIR